MGLRMQRRRCDSSPVVLRSKTLVPPLAGAEERVVTLPLRALDGRLPKEAPPSELLLLLAQLGPPACGCAGGEGRSAATGPGGGGCLCG